MFKRKTEIQTYKSVASKIKKQIVSNRCLYIKNDSVVESFLYLWPIRANTVASRRHRYFNL